MRARRGDRQYQRKHPGEPPRARGAGRPMVRAAALLAAVAALAGPGALRRAAAADDTFVFRRGERHDWLTLDPIRGNVALDAAGSWSQSSSSSGTSSSSTESVFQQTLGLSTSGGIISRNFMDFSASGTFGVSEGFSSASGGEAAGGGSGSSTGFVNAYDLATTTFKTTMLPVTLYGRRSEDYVYRSFGGVVKDTYSEYGGSAVLQSQRFPTTLRVYRTETTESELNGANAFTITQNNVEFHTQYEPAKRQLLTLDYHYVNAGQTNLGPGSNSDFDNHEVTLGHTWAIDPDNRYVLTSMLDYSNQSGDFPYERVKVDEMLRMRHTQAFQTYLQYTYDGETVLSSTSQTHQIAGGFSHRLFESLTTTGQAGYTLRDSDNGSTVNEWFANIGENYTKKVPLGLLSAFVNLGYNQSETSGSGAPQQFLHQGFTFSDSQPIVIARQNVVPSSIVVYDATGTRRLLQDIDYTVVAHRDRVEIRRALGTSILNPGDTVLIDYQTLAAPASTTDTITFGTGLRYDFQETFLRGLGVYGRYFRQDQTISSVVPDIYLPENINDYVVGADYRVWKLTFNAEQEWHMSNLSPYDATRFTATYGDRLGQRMFLRITANQTFVNYPDENNRTSFTTLNGDLDYAISRHLRARLQLGWRNEQESRTGSTMAIEDLAELLWDLRQTHVYFRVRNTWLESGGSDTTTVFFQAGIRRDF